MGAKEKCCIIDLANLKKGEDVRFRGFGLLLLLGVTQCCVPDRREDAPPPRAENPGSAVVRTKAIKGTDNVKIGSLGEKIEKDTQGNTIRIKSSDGKILYAKDYEPGVLSDHAPLLAEVGGQKVMTWNIMKQGRHSSHSNWMFGGKDYVPPGGAGKTFEEQADYLRRIGSQAEYIKSTMGSSQTKVAFLQEGPTNAQALKKLTDFLEPEYKVFPNGETIVVMESSIASKHYNRVPPLQTPKSLNGRVNVQGTTGSELYVSFHINGGGQSAQNIQDCLNYLTQLKSLNPGKTIITGGDFNYSITAMERNNKAAFPNFEFHTHSGTSNSNGYGTHSAPIDGFVVVR